MTELAAHNTNGMRILIVGATGMVGQGTLRECLAASDVAQVVTLGRTAVIQTHAKLQQLVLPDLMNLDGHESELQGFDACFFCLGVSAAGMSEEAYRHITYDITLKVAALLARLNSRMTFVYVSGSGTDSSEQGRSMWARVKGKTENDLKLQSFRSVYLFRLGTIQPLHGIKSKTPAYRRLYLLASPFLSLVRWVLPNAIATTKDVGLAMLNAARQSKGHVVVEAKDLIPLARGQSI